MKDEYLSLHFIYHSCKNKFYHFIVTIYIIVAIILLSLFYKYYFSSIFWGKYKHAPKQIGNRFNIFPL